MQDLESILRRRLVVLIIADESPAEVRREHFARKKVLTRKCALARSAGTNEDNERQFGNGNSHDAVESPQFLDQECVTVSNRLLQSFSES